MQNPAAPSSLYTTADLTSWINIARGQLAGESECCRVIGTIQTQIGIRNYNFSAINIGVAATTGLQGVINVRRLSYNVASGQKWFSPRAWQYFDYYFLNNPVPQSGPPNEWAQLGAGSSGQGSITGQGAGTMSSGNFYLDPLPDLIYTLNCDCVAYPIALATDTDVEAIPFLWSDAVSYFAAYLALLSSQTSARQADAERMFGYYTTFVKRARQFANPSVQQGIYPQTPDPTIANKFGLQKASQ